MFRALLCLALFQLSSFSLHKNLKGRGRAHQEPNSFQEFLEFGPGTQHPRICAQTALSLFPQPGVPLPPDSVFQRGLHNHLGTPGLRSGQRNAVCRRIQRLSLGVGVSTHKHTPCMAGNQRVGREASGSPHSLVSHIFFGTEFQAVQES